MCALYNSMKVFGGGGIVCVCGGGWLCCVRATRVNYIQSFVFRWKKTAEVIRSHEAIGDPHSD